MGSVFVLESHPNGNVHSVRRIVLRFKGFKTMVLALFDLARLLAIVMPWFPSKGRVLLFCEPILSTCACIPFIKGRHVYKILYILYFLK